LLFVVGLLQALVLLMQWWLVRRQDQHFRNSERAWIMTELGWYEEETLRVAESSGVVDNVNQDSTQANVKLTCRNDGRSPAWIENVRGRMDIATRASIRDQEKHKLDSFGPMEPLGAGKEKSRILELWCPGHARDDEFLNVYVVVEYRDIFGIKRETFLGYSIGIKGSMNPQNAFPMRNRNT
jgi:hypothetical protein